MQMMRIRGVWTVNAAVLIGAGLFSSFVLIPQFTEMPRAAGFGFHASVTQAGLFLLPSTVMMLLVSPLAGRLSNRVGSRVPLVLGCIATCAAFAFLAIAHARPWEFYVGSALIGVGIGLAFGASVIAATVVGHAFPTEHGFTVAFTVAAGACALATLASLAVPRPPRAAERRSPSMAMEAA